MIETCGTHHLMMNGFMEKYHSAEPGETFVYAIGDLGWSRYTAQKRGIAMAGELSGMAEIAYDLAEAKQIFLTQKRVMHTTETAPGIFEYRATKKRR